MLRGSGSTLWGATWLWIFQFKHQNRRSSRNLVIMNRWLNVSSTGHISSEHMWKTEAMHTVTRKNLVWATADRVNFGFDNNMKKRDLIIYYVLRLNFNFFCCLYLLLIVCLLIS